MEREFETNLKSKLAYMALGGVLVLAGHVLPGLVVGSASAQAGLQDAEFNEVTVRKLHVVDSDGSGRVELAVDETGRTFPDMCTAQQSNERFSR